MEVAPKKLNIGILSVVILIICSIFVILAYGYGSQVQYKEDMSYVKTNAFAIVSNAGYHCEPITVVKNTPNIDISNISINAIKINNTNSTGNTT